MLDRRIGYFDMLCCDNPTISWVQVDYFKFIIFGTRFFQPVLHTGQYSLLLLTEPMHSKIILDQINRTP